MKIFNKLLSVSIAGMVIFTSTITAFASETNSKIDILRDAGYKDYFINELTEDELSDYAYRLINAPSSVGKEEFVFEVDNISEIREFVNSNKDELAAQGVTKDQIDTMQKEIEYLSSLSLEELSSQYGISSVEAKMLIEATKPDNEYKKLDCSNENIATASGSISSSKLSFTMSYINRGTSTPSYDFTITYDWLSPYVTNIYKDSIAVALGGGFVSTVNSTSANYYRSTISRWTTNSPAMMIGEDGVARKSNYAKYSWSYEREPNTGLIFFADQSKLVYQQMTAKNKSGNIKFRLTSNTTGGQNQTCEVVSQFAHRRFSISPNITVSASGIGASININSAYDKSSQAYRTIKN